MAFILKVLKSFAKVFLFALISTYKQIVYIFNPNQRVEDQKIFDSLGMPIEENFKETEQFIFTWRQIENRINVAWNEIYCEASEGNDCPNPTLIDFNSGKQIKLRDVLSPSRPTVLNFGSCTWPPFMAQLERIKELQASFGHVADFITIYIDEAHPFDRGDFPTIEFRINRHVSINDRFNAAKVLNETNLPGRLLVDTMKNEAQRTFSALPDRLYIIAEMKVAFQGGLGPYDYKVEPVEKWLSIYAQKHK